MAQTAPERNPFMLLLHPELVLAAIEKSERLGQLNRHMCRPLDKALPGTPGAEALANEEADDGRRAGQAIS